ncbi:fibronectin type III domain-containing protein [Alkalihalobacillus sp. MEB130]|uniref:fibronectin type III domain-containing protein n=1 Tax=Alkalihalobacillus sp. MEB130 TaxID=2976704 RepID=UPI0028DD873D|nr:fibronectin type III domain-containing protein [Alkalihalobacillus sp. MEB130]MDT8858875.1 fibronectin type III domain-containing protein [Alkalihalobacillus sp. MEB130]
MKQSLTRVSMIFFSILLLQVLSMDTIFAEKKPTEVGGMIRSDTVWTKEQSPYLLTRDLQISYGRSLVVEPGVVIEGGNHSIQAFGTLKAKGSKNSNVIFKNVHVKPGSNAMDKPYLIHIEHSEVTGGSIYSPTGNAIYGSLILRDSKLINTSYLYIWYPTSDVYIERNIFKHAGGISVGTSDDVKVYIRNNVFYQQNSPYEQYAIMNWASYGKSETIVENNSFLSTDRIALRLPSGYQNSKMTASNNYWNTTDPNIIESMIYDQEDDLASADFISYQPSLSQPHSRTPFLDITAPTWHTNSQLRASKIGQTSMHLEWTPASDNVAVTHYRIYQNDTLLTTVSGKTHTLHVKNLDPFQAYHFRIEAGDKEGNWSKETIEQSFKTTDTTKPTWREDSEFFASDIKETSLTLYWTAASDNVMVSHYRIYQGDQLLATVPASQQSFTVKKLAPFQTYRFRVEAGDEAGNWSSKSVKLSVKTTDITPPKWPKNSQLTATNTKQTSLTLNWTPATDNAAVSHYRIYQGDDLLTTVSGSKQSFTVKNLSPFQSYRFRVEAGDKAGNWSSKSLRLTAKTTDTTSPKWPEGSQISASNIKKTSLTLNWNRATDNAAVSHYRIYLGDELLTTVSGNRQSFTVKNLAASQTYRFRIEAGDKAGNWTSKGPKKSFKTL